LIGNTPALVIGYWMKKGLLKLKRIVVGSKWKMVMLDFIYISKACWCTRTYTNHRNSYQNVKQNLLLIVFLIFLIFTNIKADEPNSILQNKTYEYGISAGYLFGGDINISDAPNNFQTTGAFMIKGFIDSYLSPKLSAGLYLQYSYSGIEEKKHNDEIATHNVSIIEIGGSFKPRFILNPRWAIKPGLNISYRKFFFDFTADCGLKLDNAQGMGLNASIEIQYLYSSSYILFSEIGFATQPYGGKEGITYLDFGPIFYISAGIAL